MRMTSLLLILVGCAGDPVPLRVVLEHIGTPVVALDSAVLEPTGAGGAAVVVGGPSERLSVLMLVGDRLVSTLPDGVPLVVGPVIDGLVIVEIVEGQVLATDADATGIVGLELVDQDGSWAVRVDASVPGVVAATGLSDLWFEDGGVASDGVVALAAGDPAPLAAWTAERSGLTVPLASPTWAVGLGEPGFFALGEVASAGLQILAEDGNGEVLADDLSAQGTWTDTGFKPAPDGDYGSRPALPGERFVLEMSAFPGDTLHMAWMFADSNDTFFGLRDVVLVNELGEVQLGEVSAVALYDAGTEVNEPPGIGPTQAPRQANANEGAEEGGVITQVTDEAFPAVGTVVRVTIEAAEEGR